MALAPRLIFNWLFACFASSRIFAPARRIRSLPISQIFFISSLKTLRSFSSHTSGKLYADKAAVSAVLGVELHNGVGGGGGAGEKSQGLCHRQNTPFLKPFLIKSIGFWKNQNTFQFVKKFSFNIKILSYHLYCHTRTYMFLFPSFFLCYIVTINRCNRTISIQLFFQDNKL